MPAVGRVGRGGELPYLDNVLYSALPNLHSASGMVSFLWMTPINK
jgi:hypothetical protein